MHPQPPHSYDDLRDRWFNTVIDRYLTEGTMAPEDYARLTDNQQAVVQTIKRAFARLGTTL